LLAAGHKEQERDMVNNPLIIAEVGVNHNGELALARKLVDVAVTCGANIVKFQTFFADRVVTSSAPQANYQRQNLGVKQSQMEMLSKLELSYDEHKELSGYCQRVGIEFLSTAFDSQSLDFLVDLGIKRIKIPSGELTNLPYLEKVASKGLPVILSTGMAALEEVRESVSLLTEFGVSPPDLTILHCTSSYPAQTHELNILAIETLREEFACTVGYSDHSSGCEAATMAVALGAEVIEKHITLDRRMLGPDHLASMAPEEFKQYVKSIRISKMALGDGIKRPSPEELETALIARRSIVASQKILAGEIFSAENLTAKRPGIGISPMRWREIIGRKAVRDFVKDEMIEI